MGTVYVVRVCLMPYKDCTLSYSCWVSIKAYAQCKAQWYGCNLCIHHHEYSLHTQETAHAFVKDHIDPKS